MGLLKRVWAELTGAVNRGLALHRAALYIYGSAWWNDGLFYRLYFLSLMGFTVIHSCSLLYNPLHSRIDSPEELVKIMRDMVAVGVFLTGNLKHYMVLLFRHRMRNLILYMESLPDDGLALPGKNFILLYGSVLGATGMGWIVNGLLGKGSNKLMYDENFPWDESQGLGHLAALGFQFTACNICWVQHFGVDSFSCAVCFKLFEQIRRLKEMLRSVGEDPSADKALLGEAVSLHVAILKGVRLLNDTYKFLFLFLSVYLVIHSCIIVYCIVKTDDYRYIALQLCPMMISAYTQLFVYCFVGQRLTSEMDDLTQCCYDNSWYLTPPSVRRSLLLIMKCANKPVLYHAFGITTALYATYLQNVQESFSYFLFVRTMESNMVDSLRA